MWQNPKHRHVAPLEQSVDVNTENGAVCLALWSRSHTAFEVARRTQGDQGTSG